jgi:hypothetical protein
MPAAMQDINMEMYMLSGWLNIKMDIPAWRAMDEDRRSADTWTARHEHGRRATGPALVTEYIELVREETVDGTPCEVFSVFPDAGTMF